MSNKEVLETSKKIRDHLKEVTGKKFIYNKESNLKFIRARMREGFDLDDFKYVIDVKSHQWLDDPEMDKYLRVKTLFNASNFEGYVNEKIFEKEDLSSNITNDQELRHSASKLKDFILENCENLLKSGLEIKHSDLNIITKMDLKQNGYYDIKLVPLQKFETLYSVIKFRMTIKNIFEELNTKWVCSSVVNNDIRFIDTFRHRVKKIYDNRNFNKLFVPSENNNLRKEPSKEDVWNRMDELGIDRKMTVKQFFKNKK
jgi:uncharacterized phage protein (TIGR02220 family)